MCMPLEPAYQAALQADPDLVYEISGGNVVISGPTTLMITLKLIAQIWRREKENRNAEEIARRAGTLCDKIALVAEAMNESKRKLRETSASFDTVVKRLWTGKGNLKKRAEELRSLGAKVSKQIPESIIDEAPLDEMDGE